MVTIIYILFLLSYLFGENNTRSWVYESHRLNKMYRFNISKDIFKDSPSWIPDKNKCPLSSLKAESIAKSFIRKEIKNINKFLLMTTSLVKFEDDKWFYLINTALYCKYPSRIYSDVESGPLPEINVVVLLNGKVLKPEIK